jgi:hypothetical protein
VQFQAVAATVARESRRAHFKKWVVVIFWFIAAGKSVRFANSSTPWEHFDLRLNNFSSSLKSRKT